MYNVITIGDAVIDTHVQINDASVECDINNKNCQLCLDYAAKIPVTDSFQILGGNAANIACGTTKLGLKSTIITTLGKDSNGKLIQQELKKYGVDTSLVGTDSQTKTRYSIVLNFQGERTILSYHQKRNYHWPKKMPATDWVYYTSLSEGFENLQNKLFDYLKKHPTVRLAYNPGSFQIKSALPKVRQTIAKSDIVCLNIEEAETILNTTLKKEKSISALIHQLTQLGAKEVVVTDAIRGATAGDDDEIWQIKSFPVKVMAKTGAGDAFSSGYLAARFAGHNMPNALLWGIANSSSVIGQLGAQKGLLDKNGIKKISAKFSNIKAKKIL
ncbi:MAG: hypothetical protein COU29_01860 [Candidatus Magasanikbacteria bacterium CG10_big_fil_rev_8_21_14_0_10_36_32]|uniref:Carbohydrate kinase PfkB domain-containing protein n=1 Tax=Candidatus Magasanikbacteria bacterium CG10_big_fil_rev_8_21_14_0_10_36_32 TaxID=1974646 RepID=A0A2M6W6U1_9BACT|nr:MAG: hypothetical protein COU29_01860 [Candidatus Magasanikbacteria bacterium CG10_big_fil_rev_8_21_14_0_10_36_32]